MKYNFKNPLWITNPHYAKDCFEKELRERIKEFGQQPVYLEDVLKEILGDAPIRKKSDNERAS